MRFTMPDHKTEIHSYTGSKPFAFISYSHDDLDTISGYLGAVDQSYRFWYDEGIKSGAEWVEEIGNKIFDCDIFIVFLSRSALQSHYIKDEITYAYKYAKRMMAVLLEPLNLPRSLELMLGRFQYINFYEEDSFDDCLIKFIQGIPDSVRVSDGSGVGSDLHPGADTGAGSGDDPEAGSGDDPEAGSDDGPEAGSGGTSKSGGRSVSSGDAQEGGQPSGSASGAGAHRGTGAAWRGSGQSFVSPADYVFSYHSFDYLYEIVKLLADSGCGKVYRVKSNRTGAEYIMKRIMYDKTDSTQLRMNKALFRNELQKLLLLNNKYYTPTVIDFIETDECSSLIMSEISGLNLRDLLTFYSQKLSVNFVITLVYKISLLLHDIHKSRLVYGDVKPSNFIINNFGQVFLIDLGSTCAINDPNYLKVHTPQYAAPEQMDESSSRPDYRFDVYGLGVLFKEFLDAVSRASSASFDYSLMDKCRKICRKMTDPVISNRYETIGEVTAVLDLLRPDHGDAIMRSFANTIDEWDVDKLILARRRKQADDSHTASEHDPILHNYGEEVTVILDAARPSFNYNDDKSIIVSWT